MSKVKQVRWACPNGCPGVLGPSRPRKDNIVRYCLDCSKREGKLVERIAPALERKRSERATTLAERRKAREQREKEREREYYMVAGVDLREEMKRLCRLKAFGGRNGAFARRPPKLTIRRCSRMPSSRLGFAEPWANRISVSAYPGQSAADAKDTLLHELVHVYVGDVPGGRRWHGYEFKSKFREACEEAYGFWPKSLAQNVYHGGVAAGIREKEKV